MEEALQAPNGVQLENFKRGFRRTRRGADVRIRHQRNRFLSRVQTEKRQTRRPKPPRVCVLPLLDRDVQDICFFHSDHILSKGPIVLLEQPVSLCLGCYVNNPLLGQMRCFSQTRQTSIFNDIVPFSFFLHPGWCAVCIHQIIQTHRFFFFVCCVTL